MSSTLKQPWSPQRSGQPRPKMRSVKICALMLLPSISLAIGGEKCQGVGESQEWVDLDTPAEACTTSGKGGLPFKLVFSDEFELAGRSFKDGDDARWTGIDSWPGGNAQVRHPLPWPGE